MGVSPFAEIEMITEDQEFLLSQYTGDTLSPAERVTVDALLAAHPSARQLLEEYRKLDMHLAGLRDGLPAIHWSKFSEHISIAIDDAETPAVAGRIGFGSWAGRLRIAAAILIVATIGIVLRRDKRVVIVSPPSSVNRQIETPAAPAGIAEVTGPQAEVANGIGAEEISVGPSKLAASEGTSKYAEQMIMAGSSKVVISEAIGVRRKEKSRPH